MTARITYFRRSSCSLLNWTTGIVPMVAAAFRVPPSRWYPHLILQQQHPVHHQCRALPRLRFSTSTMIRNDETEIKIDVLSKKQKNVYICKSIYRQMIRWCQNYQHQLYPPDLIQYFTQIPKQYTLVPHLFPTHDFIHQKFMQSEPRNGKTVIEEPDHHSHITTTTHTNVPPLAPVTTPCDKDSMERAFTSLNQIPIVQYNAKKNRCLVISIQTITDVQNCIRALFRMNIHHSTQTNTPHSTSQQQEIEEYEKLCRNVAFEEMKHMNETSVELQKCQQQRQIRLNHVFPSLQRYVDHCSNKNIDMSHKILHIGQVVQHKKDRWRGVIVHWSYDDGTRKQKSKKKPLSTNVRDDFTSLTFKSYTASMEEKNSGDDDDDEKVAGPTASAKNTDQFQASLDSTEDTPTIVYEIAMDDGTVLEEDQDDDDVSDRDDDSISSSSSSLLLKRHLLHTYQTVIPTFITVRQPLTESSFSGGEKSTIETSITTPSLSPTILDVVQDKHLRRIRNTLIRRIFAKYDTLTNSYVPKSYMNYTYPNWYPTSTDNNINDMNDTIMKATSNPNIPENIETNEYNTETYSRNSAKIMSHIIEQIKSFALHLVSIIDNTIGTENQKENHGNNSSSSTNRDHTNQLMDVMTELRDDMQSLAVLDPISAHIRFSALPLSRQLSLQLRTMEYFAVTVVDAMYKRRRNKASSSITTISESDQYLPEPHEPVDNESMSKNKPFTPKFHLGQIVRHKKYNFRGVIIGRDSEPIYNVSRWDGLRDVPNANDLPFYGVIPDQQDCIEIFGGERPTRYVCEVNLEPCPSDQMYLDVDVDVDWMKLPDGSYRPPPFERFKYGYDNDEDDTPDAINDYNAFEKCMLALESEINQWHCECSRFQILQQTSAPKLGDVATTTNGESSSRLQKYAISIHDMIGLLQVAENVDDARSIRETIKLFGKAHPSIELRSKLQNGIDLMVADNCEKARNILRSIVTEGDPTYIDAWNYLANSENFLSLSKDALASAKKASELNRKDFQAYTQLGILHFQQGEYGKAEVNFRNCLDLDPWSIVSSKLSECVDLIKEGEKGKDETSSTDD